MRQCRQSRDVGTGGEADRVQNSRGGGDQEVFAKTLRPEWPFGIRHFNQQAFNLAFDKHRVDGTAKVMRGSELEEFYGA